MDTKQKSFIGLRIRDSNRCPQCGQLHDFDHCDDWHYCTCGYWWRAENGKVVSESYEGKVAFQSDKGSP